MTSRLLAWMLIALGLATFNANRVAAQNPLPAGVMACDFHALARSDDPGGPAIREAPREDGRELGRLPAMMDKEVGRYGRVGELPELRVLGTQDGWFLVEGATYQEPFLPKLYATR